MAALGHLCTTPDMLNPTTSTRADAPVVPRSSAARLGWFALLLGVLLAGTCPGQGKEPSAATKLAALTLQDVNGARLRPFADTNRPATLFFFLMHECPVANAYAPEINRIVAEHPSVRSYIVYVESDLTAEAARRHVKEYGFTCPALLDPRHELVRAAGATVSPEAALFSPAGELIYRGRIDDRVTDFGKRRVQPTRRDLRQALEAFLAGRPVPDRRTKAIGCYIPESTPTRPTPRQP
jgi:peroxiredoxin